VTEARRTILYLCTFLLLSGALHGWSAPSGADSTAHPAAIPADSLIASDTTDTVADSISAKRKKAKQSGKKQKEFTDTVRYEADFIDYDAEGKKLQLSGNARIEYQKIILYADTIVYLIDQDIFAASGMPQLIESGDTTVGDSMVYNIKTRRGRVNHASTHLSDAYFNGQRIVKSDKNELYVDAGDYTTCAVVDTPHFCFYGRHIKMVPNEKIISRPVVFNIGEAPVAALPFFIFPIERKRRSGFLTPVWGGHPNGGGYLDNLGYYFAPNDYVDLTLTTRVYEFKEFIANAASSYNLKYRMNGSISTRYTVNSDFANSRQEWAVNYSHNQNITPDGKTRLSGSGNLVSASDFFKQFSEDSSELREQNLKANLALSQQIEAINGSVNLSWNRSHDLRTSIINENLPELTFNLPSRPLIPQDKENPGDSLHWFNTIYWGYSARGLMKHTGSSNDTIKEEFHPGMSNSFNLSAPQKLFKYISVSPNFNAGLAVFRGYKDTAILRIDTLHDTVSYVITSPFTDRQYTDYTLIDYDTIARNPFAEPESIMVRKQRRTITEVHREHPTDIAYVPTWNAGVSMSTNLYGMFPIKLFNFAGLRHTFSPSLSYTFTPEKKLLDKEFYDVGISYDRGHKRSQQLGISLRNQFDGKTVKEAKPGEKPVEDKFSILSVDASTSYNFEAETRKLGDVSANASTGFKNIRLTSGANFWMYDQNDALHTPILNRFNLNLSIGTLSAKGNFWGGDFLVLDSLYPRDDINYANADNTGWSVSLTPSYSFSISRTSPTELFVPEKRYSLSSSAGCNITRNWSFQWSSTYNFQSDQWVQNSINIACDLECWNMKFQWRPERLNPGYYFLINIKKIPEIKWEQRRG
jgi:lipopolysaccharide assembly outer membrane protein LptD (OstA)